MYDKAYKTNITDAEWTLIRPFIPEPKTNGRAATIARRQLVNAIFYVLKTGCGWEWLPHDFPHWKTVYHYFRLWRDSGVWEALHTALREALRRAIGRDTQPSAAIIDSQSVKTTRVGGDVRGYDGGKKIKGRKRHIVVDTQGFVLNVAVHRAAIADRDGAAYVLTELPTRYPRITKLWTDSGYNGRFRTWTTANLPTWNVEMVKHWWTGLKTVWVAPGQEPPKIPTGFQVLPKRGIVERTFAWLGHYRRLSKDYERLPVTSETWVYLAMTRVMVRRLSNVAIKTPPSAS